APRLSTAHRDRLRVRPFDAGATIEANHFEMVPTPAEVAVSRPSIRQMSCCEAGCTLKVPPVGHGDLPLRVLRGVSAMRETCPAIGAGAELEYSINDFAIASRRRAQRDGPACRSPGTPGRGHHTNA